MEESCIVDSDKAVDEADVIGVVHDAANEYTQKRLDSKVLRILHLYREKHSFLILNKVGHLAFLPMLGSLFANFVHIIYLLTDR